MEKLVSVTGFVRLLTFALAEAEFSRVSKKGERVGRFGVELYRNEAGEG